MVARGTLESVRNLVAALLPRRPVNVDVVADAGIDIAHRHHSPAIGIPFLDRVATGQQLEQYGESSIVYPVVRRISSDVARHTWALFQTADRRGRLHGDDGRRQVDNHAFLDLWARPNRWYTPTGRAMRQLCQMWLELLGEATIHVVTGPGGMPVELWPVPPSQLEPVPHPREFLSGWIHTSPDGTKTPLQPDEIIQLKYPNPDNPYRGLSPLHAALLDVESTVEAAAYQRHTFKNSAIPGGVLSSDADMTPSEFAEWVERYSQQHTGARNAGRIAVMDKGGKFIQTTMTNVDMQLRDLIDADRGNIREAWGISKTMLGQTEDVNRATAEAAEYVYGRYMLSERIDLWREAGAVLLERFGSVSRSGRRPRFELDIVEELTHEATEEVVADRDSRVTAVTAFVDAGFDETQVLELFGFPPLGYERPPPPQPFGAPTTSDDDDEDDEGVSGVVHTHITAADDDDDDSGALQDAWALALDSLTGEYLEVQARWRDELVAVLEPALEERGLEGLEDVDVSSLDLEPAVQAITARMLELGTDAAWELANQAAKAGVRVEVTPPDPRLMREAATGAAQLLASRVVASAKGAVMRSWSQVNVDE